MYGKNCTFSIFVEFTKSYADKVPEYIFCIFSSVVEQCCASSTWCYGWALNYGSHVCASGAVKLDFRTYIRRYTSPN